MAVGRSALIYIAVWRIHCIRTQTTHIHIHLHPHPHTLLSAPQTHRQVTPNTVTQSGTGGREIWSQCSCCALVWMGVYVCVSVFVHVNHQWPCMWAPCRVRNMVCVLMAVSLQNSVGLAKTWLIQTQTGIRISPREDSSTLLNAISLTWWHDHDPIHSPQWYST